MPKSRVAIVHNWLTDRGGSENILFELCNMFPDAPVYALVYNKDNFPELAKRQVITTWLQHIPWLRWRHEYFPPLRFLIWRFTKIKGYDLVITSSSSENKAVSTPGALHIAYIHTPPHYYWRYYREYLANPGFGKADPLARFFLRLLNPILKNFDFKAAQNPDYLLANSKFIQGQIKHYYKRESTILYPFVDTEKFTAKSTGKHDYYLTFGRLTPFKKTMPIVEAFNISGKKLVVAGAGPELGKLVSVAKDNILFEGRVADERLAELVCGAKACIFAGEEDFGIAWVESMAAGTPVICYGSGGALETVVAGKTGVFFEKQTPVAINEAVKEFEAKKWDRQAIARHAQNYDLSAFRKNLSSYLAKKQ